ncbi:hypothetical protein WCV21_09770 [Lactobacillus helveticus]|uniref:hypothetical protein n=1 Tax=Lactobacillus helveticus TaxID=1587 RepID=UPI00374F824F
MNEIEKWEYVTSFYRISFIYFGGVRMNEIEKWEYVTSFYRLATIYILHAKCELKMFKFL